MFVIFPCSREPKRFLLLASYWINFALEPLRLNHVNNICFSRVLWVMHLALQQSAIRNSSKEKPRNMKYDGCHLKSQHRPPESFCLFLHSFSNLILYLIVLLSPSARVLSCSDLLFIVSLISLQLLMFCVFRSVTVAV